MPPSNLPVDLARRSVAAIVATSAATTGGGSGKDGKDNNNNNNQHHPVTISKTPPAPMKYQPSIFRYTCRGRLTLDSRTKKDHAGVCHGIQTQLEHVDHWRTTTEEEALQWFQTKAAWADASAAAAATAAAQDQAGEAAHALSTAHVSNVLVYPSSDGSNSDRKSSRTKSAVPVTDPPTKEEWSCYGTTEVDLLVLRPQQSKEEKIAAVAPFCAPGMTIRDVHALESAGTIDRTSTIRLGILEILYQSTMEDDDYDDELDEEEVTTATATQDAKSNEEAKEHHTSISRTTKYKRKKKKQDEEETDGQPRPSFPTRVWNSSQKIVTQMQMNAQLIYEATQEDFAERTIQASQRIINEFPKQLDRTLDLMWRVVTWDWPPPPDHDDGPGGGPPPPAI